MEFVLFSFVLTFLVELYNVADKTPYLKNTRLATYKSHTERGFGIFIENTLSSTFPENEIRFDKIMNIGIWVCMILLVILHITFGDKYQYILIQVLIMAFLFFTSSLKSLEDLKMFLEFHYFQQITKFFFLGVIIITLFIWRNEIGIENNLLEIGFKESDLKIISKYLPYCLLPFGLYYTCLIIAILFLGIINMVKKLSLLIGIVLLFISKKFIPDQPFTGFVKIIKYTNLSIAGVIMILKSNGFI